MLRKVSLFRVARMPTRNIQYSAANGMREITVEKSGNTTTIEGRIVPSQREPYLIKPDKDVVENSCPLCRLNLNIKHTDVLILKQFVTSEGELLPRKVTGLCLKQHRLITGLVAMAQEAGLLGKFKTWEGHFDPSNRSTYKQFNTYYDETTIKLSYPPSKLKPVKWYN